MKTYLTGTKADVIANMAMYAIRDQRALIEAHSPLYGEPSEDAAREIRDAENSIEDFKRLAKALGPKASRTS